MVRRSNLISYNTLSLVSFLAIVVFSTQVFSQTSPSKIRGYKVHNAEVTVSSDPEDLGENDRDVLVNFEDPVVSGVSLKGVTFDVRASITSFSQSGTIDFVSFEDFKINGIKVEIAEFKESFSLTKGDTVTFSSPIRVSVSGVQGAKAMLEEVRGSEDQWRISGKAFVFGKFKKGIFKFKRVIPVVIDLTVERPSVKIPYVNAL